MSYVKSHLVLMLNSLYTKLKGYINLMVHTSIKGGAPRNLKDPICLLENLS